MAAALSVEDLVIYDAAVKKCAVKYPVERGEDPGCHEDICYEVDDMHKNARHVCPWNELTPDQRSKLSPINNGYQYADSAEESRKYAVPLAAAKADVAEMYYAQRGPLITAARAYLKEIKLLRTKKYDQLLAALASHTTEPVSAEQWLRDAGIDGFGEGRFSPIPEAGAEAFSAAANESLPDAHGTSPVRNFPGRPGEAHSGAKVPNFFEGNKTVTKSVYGLDWASETSWEDMGFRGKSWKIWYPGMPNDYATLVGYGFPPDTESLGETTPAYEEEDGQSVPVTQASYTFSENYPHLWATNVGMILGQLRALLVSRTWDEALSDIGGSFEETAIKHLEGTGGKVTEAFANIFHWNHGWVGGMLGTTYEGGRTLESETYTKGCNLYDGTPFNAYYANHTGVRTLRAATSSDGKALKGIRGLAHTSIDAVLNSGGPYMQTMELGTSEARWKESGWDMGYGPWQGNQNNNGIFADADDKSGGWSLIANGRRAIRQGKMFQKISGKEDFGKDLASFGAAVVSIADRLRTHSAAIVDVHREILKGTCEISNELKEKLPDHQKWWKLDAGLNDIMDGQADAALSSVQFDLENIHYGNDREALLFKEQCFLLTFIAPLSAHKKITLDRRKDPKVFKKLPYHVEEWNEHAVPTNSTILFDADPYAFLNKLTQNPNAAALHNATPHELSNLQPFIRLYKVIFDDDGNEQEVEIAFNSHFSQDELEIFKTSKNRGVGAGLKSFNFTYDGSNPFSVKKSIKANLKIFANSFGELHRTRNDRYGTPYRYLDLAMKTWNTSPGGSDNDNVAYCSTKYSNPLEENIKNSELNFRLKAQVGLSVPSGDYNSISTELLKALKESFVTLQLTPTVHNFEFDEMGRVTFNLNFLAYIEQFFDQKMFNVFAQPQVTKERYKREFKMKYFKKSCSQEKVDQQKKDYGDKAQQEIARSISSLTTSMMASDLIYYIDMPYSVIKTFLLEGPYADYEMMEAAMKPRQNKEHNEILKENIENAMATAFADQGDTGIGGGEDAERRKKQVAAALVGSDPSRTSMAYFYLSDMIDTILINIESELEYFVQDGLSEMEDDSDIDCRDITQRRKELLSAQKSFKKLRFLFGPLELTHPQAQDGKKSLWVNLGDIPISVKYFAEWIADKMLSKDEVFYPLTRFVNDLLNDLVRNFLNNESCFGYSIKQKTRVQQASITGYGSSTTFDPITNTLIGIGSAAVNTTYTAEAGGKVPVGSAIRRKFHTTAMRADMIDFEGMNPVINPSGPSGSPRSAVPIENTYNYFVFFAGRTMPVEKMNGDKTADEKMGIFHHTLGRDRGLLKNIKLTKTETKGLAEVRFEQDGYNGLEQLRVIYDAQIDMFANVNTFPGTYVFIDPRGFAPDMSVGLGKGEFGLTKLGIGGYYMIVRSEHEFAEGKANTILHTKWVNQIAGENDNNENEDVTTTYGTGDAVPGRCSIKLRPDPNEQAADAPDDNGIPWVPFI